MGDISKKMGNALKYIVFTHIGRVVALLLLLPLFSYISDVATNDCTGTVFYVLFVVCAVILSFYTLVFIVFAWVINPMREYSENRKIREHFKK